jgi:hypothetical protein
MKKILTTAILVLLISTISYTTSSAKTVKEEAIDAIITDNKILISTKETIDISAMLKKINSNKVPKQHLLILYTILQNTNEHYIHNMNGVTSNRVFLSTDGHNEAVYNRKGNLVKDGINDGSYNYASPKDEPLIHYLIDINPWIFLGNSKTDSTSKQERLFYYLSDLEYGIKRALFLNKAGELNENIEFSKNQKAALALFLQLIDISKTPIIFDLFNQKDKVTDQQILKCLNQLKFGFHKIYINH